MIFWLIYYFIFRWCTCTKYVFLMVHLLSISLLSIYVDIFRWRLLCFPKINLAISSFKKRNIHYLSIMCTFFFWLLYCVYLCLFIPCFTKWKHISGMRHTRFWRWLSGAPFMASPKGNLFIYPAISWATLVIYCLSIDWPDFSYLSIYLCIHPLVHLFVNFSLGLAKEIWYHL